MTRPSRRDAFVATPNSGVGGIQWPALPGSMDIHAFAILYQIEQSQWWSPDELLAAQFRQVGELAEFALRNIPYYSDRLAPLRGLAPGALTQEIWRTVPILTRAELQAAGPALDWPAPLKGHGRVIPQISSGSTGRPVTVQCTELALLYRRAARLRGNRWHRRDYAGKVASIKRLTDGQRRVAEEGLSVGWAAGYPTGPLVYRDIAGPVDDHLAWLAAENPDYLITYSTTARAFAERAIETGLKLPALKEINPLGEVVDPDLRDLCRRAWNVAVVDQYAAKEAGVIAAQCPEHAHYHIEAEDVLVEILDRNDMPCPPGAVGRVVVTPLHNFATPLFRYEIGDYAEAGPACSCGRGLPVIRRILGRTRNMAILPSGERSFPRLESTALSRIRPLRQIQLVQRRREDVDVRLVVSRELNRAELAELRECLTRALGHPFPLRVHYVDDIPRSPGGKYEDFRCEISG